MKRVAAVGAMLSLVSLAVGCAARDGSSGITHPTSGDQLVLRVETSGGLIAPSASFTAIPGFSLYGDGTVVEQGPQPDIYPGPALLSVVSFRLSPDGIEAILRAAQAAGLTGPDRSYLRPGIPDAGFTTFTLVAGGRAHVVKMSAVAPGAPGIPSSETEARRKLTTFEAKLFNLNPWLPKGSIGTSRQYGFDRLAVLVTAGTPRVSGGLKEPLIAWPLAESLATFGEPITGSAVAAEARCGVVSGADLQSLMPDVRRATQITPWTSDGRTYSLALRPLLPDESTCPLPGMG